MTMPVRLKEHLEKSGASYSMVSHMPARSSQYAAALLHISGKQVAKTVVLRAAERVLLAVLPASCHINMEKLGQIVGAPVKLVEERECNKLFPDCQPGAIPPFGELYGLPIYLDGSLAEDPEIVFSAGNLSDGIRMGNLDFVHLARPKVCAFAEEGEPIGIGSREDISYGGSE